MEKAAEALKINVSRGTRKGESMSDWISVKEQQPDRKGIYLARLSDGVYSILGYCNCTDGDMIWFEEGQENDLIEVTNVTHWMPLPEPPEDGEHETDPLP